MRKEGPLLNQTVLLLCAASGVAIALHPFLRMRQGLRTSAALVAGSALLLMPLLLPGPGLDRVVLAIACALLALKIVDVSVGASRGHQPDFRAYLAYLTNIGLFVLRRADAEPVGSRRENALRLVQGILLMAGGFLLLQGLYLVAWRDWPFAVEHVFKGIGFFLGVLGMFELLTVLPRLLGAPARIPHLAPFAARTPADFWRRYNRLIQQFLHENVFKPLGGRRQPVAATLLVFFVSGLIHEYLFSLAAGHFQGYQITFFMVQGLAVAATLRIKPRGWTIFPWIAATLVFNIATGTLFLASFHQILPLYANPLPPWLAGW